MIDPPQCDPASGLTFAEFDCGAFGLRGPIRASDAIEWLWFFGKLASLIPLHGRSCWREGTASPLSRVVGGGRQDHSSAQRPLRAEQLWKSLSRAGSLSELALSKQGEHAGVAVDAVPGDFAIGEKANERNIAKGRLKQFGFFRR